MKPSLVKEFCEFLGVTFLCFIAVGISVLGKSPSPAEASLVAGTAIALIIYGVGTISGAHVNPAVSLGFLVSGRFSNSQFFRYVAAQVLGSIAAFLALLALLALSGQNYNWAAAAPKIVSPAAFCVETFLTGSLVFTIFSVATGDCRICPETRPLAAWLWDLP